MTGWKKTTIGEAFSFTSKPRGLTMLAEIPFIPMEALREFGEQIDPLKIKLVKSVSSGTYVENGDLLLAKITPSFENGKQGFVNLTAPFAYATTEVLALQEKPGVSDKYFLAYWLRQPEIRSVLAGKMEGATGRQRLNKSVLEHAEIYLPSRSEQTAIARVLTSVQAAIAEQERLIEKLKELKRSMMNRLFTRGTKGEKVRMTEIGEIPESWAINSFASVVERVKAINSKNIPLSQYVAQGKYPIIDQGQSAIGGYTDDEERVISSGLPYIVFGDHTRVVKYVDFPFSLGADGTKLIKPVKRFDPRFFYYYIQHINLPSRGYNRHYSVLKEKLVPEPNSAEQKRIGDILDVIDRRITVSMEKNQTLRVLFVTLLHELMSGERRVAA